jgi:hypothetical protein
MNFLRNTKFYEQNAVFQFFRKKNRNNFKRNFVFTYNTLNNFISYILLKLPYNQTIFFVVVQILKNYCQNIVTIGCNWHSIKFWAEIVFISKT